MEAALNPYPQQVADVASSVGKDRTKHTGEQGELVALAAAHAPQVDGQTDHVLLVTRCAPQGEKKQGAVGKFSKVAQASLVERMATPAMCPRLATASVLNRCPPQLPACLCQQAGAP